MSSFAILFTFTPILVIIHQYHLILIMDLICDWVRRKQELYQEKEISSLLEKINECKSRLYEAAERNGANLTSEETVKRSQELDQLIFQYQKASLKKPLEQIGGKAMIWSMMFVLPNVLAEV